GSDIAALAAVNGVELVLVDAPADLAGGASAELAALFERSLADVAVLGARQDIRAGGVFVPFARGGPDRAGLEVGPWPSGARGPAAGRCAGPARARTPLATAATRAGCSHTRRWRCNA